MFAAYIYKIFYLLAWNSAQQSLIVFGHLANGRVIRIQRRWFQSNFNCFFRWTISFFAFIIGISLRTESNESIRGLLNGRRCWPCNQTSPSTHSLWSDAVTRQLAVRPFAYCVFANTGVWIQPAMPRELEPVAMAKGSSVEGIGDDLIKVLLAVILTVVPIVCLIVWWELIQTNFDRTRLNIYD